jgi:geranylgeranyl pyrophosphate synthase
MQPIPSPCRDLERIAQHAQRHAGGESARAALEAILAFAGSDLTAVELELRSRLDGASRCGSAGRELVLAGGKRLRPALALLVSRLVRPGRPCPERVVRLAVAVEMLHSATLLHDDVIDEAPRRRGAPSARVTWGNTVSVIAGDLLLVRALESCASLGEPELDALVRRTLERLVLGEVEQLERRGALEMDVETFERIAGRKTASLFELAAAGAALLAGARPGLVQAAGDFARHAGLAFQLRDDLLDLGAGERELGKQLGRDLATGSVTLPMSEALAGEPALRDELGAWFAGGGSGELPEPLARRVASAAWRRGRLARCSRLLLDWAELAACALDAFPPCAERDALRAMALSLACDLRGGGEPDTERH